MALVEIALPINPGLPGGPVLAGGARYALSAGGAPARITTEEIRRFATGGFNGMAFDPDNAHVWVTIYNASAAQCFLKKYRLSDGAEVYSANPTSRQFMGIHRYGATLYLATYVANRVNVVDISGAPSWSEINLGFTLGQVVRVQDRLWAKVYSSGTLTEFDLAGVATGRTIASVSRIAPAPTDDSFLVMTSGTSFRRYMQADVSVIANTYASQSTLNSLPGRAVAYYNIGWDPSGKPLGYDRGHGHVDRWNIDGSFDRRFVWSQGEVDGSSTQLDSMQGVNFVTSDDGRYFSYPSASDVDGALTPMRIIVVNVQTQTATWTIPGKNVARTLNGIAIPGAFVSGLGPVSASQLGLDVRRVRCFYRVGAGSLVEFSPGARLGSVPIPANATVEIRVEFRSPLGMPRLGPEPFVGAVEFSESNEITAYVDDPSPGVVVPSWPVGVISLPLNPVSEGGPTLTGNVRYAQADGPMPARLTTKAEVIFGEGYFDNTNAPGGWLICPTGEIITCRRATNTVAKWSSTGVLLMQVTMTAPTHIALHDDGLHVWIMNYGGAARLVRISDLAVVTTIPAFNGITISNPYRCAKTPGKDVLWVTGTANQSAPFHEMSTVTGTWTGRSTPSIFGMAVNPAGTHVFMVTCGGSWQIRKYAENDLATPIWSVALVNHALPGGAAGGQGVASAGALTIYLSPLGFIAVGLAGGAVDVYLDSGTAGVYLGRLAWPDNLGIAGFSSHDYLNYGGLPYQDGHDATYVVTPAYESVPSGSDSPQAQRLRITQVGDGDAVWTVPALAERDRTLKAIAIPGRLGTGEGNGLPLLASRCHYQIVGHNGWTEFTPGAYLNVTVPAGAEVLVRVRFLDPRTRPPTHAPFVGAVGFAEANQITVFMDDQIPGSVVPYANGAMRRRAVGNGVVARRLAGPGVVRRRIVEG